MVLTVRDSIHSAANPETSQRGGWVNEKWVIDKLSVSRMPFREAIRILAAGGGFCTLPQ
jgi:DNA-binding GntR family transcriptional regulator